MSFADLKRNKQSSLEKLTQELDKLSTKKTYDNDDSAYWKPTVDKVGNGSATIRFLPGASGDDLPFVRIWDHGFKGPTGKWYIEKSLTTIGLQDPLAELNSELWNVSNDDNSATRKQAREQKRRLHYVSNILVVRDPGNPENEGKVFLFQYGKKIFDKLNDLMNPQFDDEVPINPFDMWGGANFKLKIRQVEGYRNYDKSEFEGVSEIPGDEAVQEKIYNSQHSLKELVDPSKFKSYDELKKKLVQVLGSATLVTTTAETAEIAQPTYKEKPAEDIPFSTSDDDDEDMSYFEKLKKLSDSED